MLVEVEVKVFVGVVDAELFEAVVLEVLKAEDIQDSYAFALSCGWWSGLFVVVKLE